jgi:hypothetical protein
MTENQLKNTNPLYENSCPLAMSPHDFSNPYSSSFKQAVSKFEDV